VGFEETEVENPEDGEAVEKGEVVEPVTGTVEEFHRPRD